MANAAQGRIRGFRLPGTGHSLRRPPRGMERIGRAAEEENARDGGRIRKRWSGSCEAAAAGLVLVRLRPRGTTRPPGRGMARGGGTALPPWPASARWGGMEPSSRPAARPPHVRWLGAAPPRAAAWPGRRASGRLRAPPPSLAAASPWPGGSRSRGG